MSKHYFIGIKVPKEIAVELERTRKSWDLKSHKRYTSAEDMHITLVFIGADPQKEIEEVQEALEHIDHKPFILEITGVDTFGKTSTPSVIYAALKESQELKGLQGKVQEALTPFSLQPDKKPFTPHITLAKKWAGGEPVYKEMPLAPATFKVTEFTLFEIIQNQVPSYLPVKTYPLEDSE